MKPSRPPRAFTLVEVLTALTICGFAMAGIMTLFFYVVQNNYIAEQRLAANDDVRYFTAQMIADARASNILRLYKSFYPYTTINNTFPFIGTTPGNFTYNGATYNNANSTSVTPFTVDNPLDSLDQVPLGMTGDYVVFASYSDPFIGYTGIGNVQAMYVTRIILYWVAPNINFSNETAMYRFDSKNTNGVLPWNGVTLGPTTSVISSTTTLESLLPANTLANAQANWAHIVLNDIRGQAIDNISGNTGLNFINWQSTNRSNSSILMHALILHGNSAKRLTDTYNFTITPGG
jgi:type II secretory pathway pseudopilin PulG